MAFGEYPMSMINMNMNMHYGNEINYILIYSVCTHDRLLPDHHQTQPYTADLIFSSISGTLPPSTESTPSITLP